jgi:hypothetical protein
MLMKITIFCIVLSYIVNDLPTTPYLLALYLIFFNFLLQANPSITRSHKPVKSKHDLEASQLGLHFVVTPQHFINGRLKVQ